MASKSSKRSSDDSGNDCSGLNEDPVEETQESRPSYEDLLAENTAMRDQCRLLESILKNAPILISAKDLQGNILFTNSHFSVLKGPKPEDYVNKNVYDLFPKDIADQLWQNDLKAQQSDTSIKAEERVHHQDDSLHTYHTTKFRLTDHTNELMGTCAVSFDITHLKELEHEALHDHLTGLYNRRYLEAITEREVARAARQHSILVFSLFDLDGFKAVNDQYGHILGDQVLKSTANTLTHNMNRPSDFCFRFGGDEFAAVFQTDSVDKGIALVESLREAINSSIAAIIPEDKELCKVSAGIRAVKPGDDVTILRLYEEADKALYHAKKSGKNRCLIHHD